VLVVIRQVGDLMMHDQLVPAIYCCPHVVADVQTPLPDRHQATAGLRQRDLFRTALFHLRRQRAIAVPSLFQALDYRPEFRGCAPVDSRFALLLLLQFRQVSGDLLIDLPDEADQAGVIEVPLTDKAGRFESGPPCRVG
jgi:hypothetical protein